MWMGLWSAYDSLQANLQLTCTVFVFVFGLWKEPSIRLAE